MKFVIKIPHWSLFLLVLFPLMFVGAGVFTYLFLLTTLFFYLYWIISIGKYGWFILRLNNSISKSGRVLLNRAMFVFYALFFYISAQHEKHPTLKSSVLLTAAAILLLLSFLGSIISSSVVLAKLGGDKKYFSKVFYYSILLILFPVGVWVIQPEINEKIGKEFE